MGLRLKRYGPEMTSFWGGRSGEGVPRPAIVAILPLVLQVTRRADDSRDHSPPRGHLASAR